MADGTPRYKRYIRVTPPSGGVVQVEIGVQGYPMVGLHWKEQLTGANLRKWGRIYIDDDPSAKRARRRLALYPFGRLYAGEVGNNLDECPGAMFVWENQDQVAHVMPCDARANQDLGRDLYNALRAAIVGPMGWYEVRFSFA